jgi:THO complex subunit 2
MRVYNAIVVMKEILPVFPMAAVLEIGASLDRAMQDFLETEERGDLKILGRA